MPDASTLKSYIITSRRVLTAAGLQEAGIVVEDGVIADVVGAGRFPANIPIKDFGDRVVMPGLVDTHVHINEPGRTKWEGFTSATKAAAAGGVTMLVDMPLNSSPVTTTPHSLQKKIAASHGKLFVDCGFYGGLVPGNTASLKPLADAGILGVKAFMIDSGIDEFPSATEQDLRAGMKVIAENGLPLLVHAELSNGSEAGVEKKRQPRSYAAYLSSHPRQWEHDAIKVMIRLCREYNCRTHIVHLSSADEVPQLREARQAGLPLTVETCPHYLYFSAEDVSDGDTRLKCSPPIRENENRNRLWDSLREGVIESIVSDHSACPPDMKKMGDGDFHKSWGGISSLQLGLSIVWTEASKRGFTLLNVAEWMCRRPAELVGLQGRKGAIAPGYDADIVVWNPEASFRVEASSLHHRHRMTPYEGRALFGKVEKTFLRGRKIFDNGTFIGSADGKVVLKNKN
jgi:allantoinase